MDCGSGFAGSGTRQDRLPGSPLLGADGSGSPTALGDCDPAVRVTCGKRWGKSRPRREKVGEVGERGRSGAWKRRTVDLTSRSCQAAGQQRHEGVARDPLDESRRRWISRISSPRERQCAGSCQYGRGPPSRFHPLGVAPSDAAQTATSVRRHDDSGRELPPGLAMVIHRQRGPLVVALSAAALRTPLVAPSRTTPGPKNYGPAGRRSQRRGVALAVHRQRSGIAVAQDRDHGLGGGTDLAAAGEDGTPARLPAHDPRPSGTQSRAAGRSATLARQPEVRHRLGARDGLEPCCHVRRHQP